MLNYFILFISLWVGTFIFSSFSFAQESGLDVMGLRAIWPYGKTLFYKAVKNNSSVTLFLKASLYRVHFSKKDAQGKEADTPLNLQDQLDSISLLTPKLVIPPHEVGYFRMVMPKGYIQSPNDTFYRLSITNDVATRKKYDAAHGLNKKTTHIGFQVSVGYMIALIVPGNNPDYGHVILKKKHGYIVISNNDNTVIPVDLAGICIKRSLSKLCSHKGYFSIEELIYPHKTRYYSLQNIRTELRIVVNENNKKRHYTFSTSF